MCLAVNCRRRRKGSKTTEQRMRERERERRGSIYSQLFSNSPIPRCFSGRVERKTERRNRILIEDNVRVGGIADSLRLGLRGIHLYKRNSCHHRDTSRSRCSSSTLRTRLPCGYTVAPVRRASLWIDVRNTTRSRSLRTVSQRAGDTRTRSRTHDADR